MAENDVCVSLWILFIDQIYGVCAQRHTKITPILFHSSLLSPSIYSHISGIYPLSQWLLLPGIQLLAAKKQGYGKHYEVTYNGRFRVCVAQIQQTEYPLLEKFTGIVNKSEM